MTQTYFQFALEFRTVVVDDRNDVKIAKGQVALLAALVLANDHRGTLDDATADLSATFDDGGKWRGRITLGLSVDGIIAEVGATNSKRIRRNRGLIRRWRLVDVDKARRKIESLKRWLDATKKPLTVAPVAASESNNTQSTNNHGGNNHASE